MSEQGSPSAVLRFVQERIGLSCQSVRGDRAAHAVLAGMQRASLFSEEAYVDLLRLNPDVFDRLVSDLTVPESYFFRDPAHFRFIAEVALPQLRLARPTQHVFRAWSAGCATGEEPYSLAILFEEQGLAQRSKVWGTDVSRRALEHAKRALYHPWALRGVSTERVTRYFHRTSTEQLRLDARFSERVSFGRHSLSSAVYPSAVFGGARFDFVLCRNVLIYLAASAIQTVSRLFFESLAEGGFLLTGPSDPLLKVGSDWQVLRTDAGIFYRKVSAESRATLPPVPEPHAHAFYTAELPSQPVQAHAPQADREGKVPVGVEVTSRCEDAPTRIKQIANQQGSLSAEASCREALASDGLSCALHYLHASLLLDLGRLDDADAALRRVLYLDASLAAAHFMRAVIERSRGDLTAAQRSYRRPDRRGNAR